MTERLKQIWSGFESETQRNLTGRGVENVVVPHREDYQPDDASFLSEEFVSPAEVAFAALKAELATKQKRAKSRTKSGRPAQNYADTAPPAPLSSRASDDGAPEAAKEMIRGLRATRALTERSDIDYAQFIANGGDKQLKSYVGKRKKFFGLF